MIKVLLFDADGVLLFHTDKIFSVRLSEYLDIPVGRINPFFEKVFGDCLVGLKDLREELAPYAKDWGWQGSIDELLTFWFEYEHNVDQPLINYISALRDKGTKSYVATNNEKYRAEALFGHLNLDQTVFEKLYAAGNLTVLKPDLAFYQKIYDDLIGIKKNEVLLWDDSIQNVEAARNYGFEAELYTTYQNFEVTMEQYV